MSGHGRSAVRGRGAPGPLMWVRAPAPDTETSGSPSIDRRRRRIARAERANHPAVPGAAGFRQHRQRGDVGCEASKGTRNPGRLDCSAYITGTQIGCRNCPDPTRGFWLWRWENPPLTCATPIVIHSFSVGASPPGAHHPTREVDGWMFATEGHLAVVIRLGSIVLHHRGQACPDRQACPFGTLQRGCNAALHPTRPPRACGVARATAIRGDTRGPSPATGPLVWL